ncbi:MAG: T9SS type A sorting domain-containing protein [Sphingobacteriales bacterium]|nr:T9SS type A sorting domain-containing protein [Sphingobacteriales bacterium]
MNIRNLLLLAWLSIAFTTAVFAQNGNRPAFNASPIPYAPNPTSNTPTPTPANQNTLYSQGVVVVEDILDPYGINIYPNPADDILYVEVNTLSQISLRTHLGEVLYQTSGEGRISIDTSIYPNGVYYVVVQNGISLPTSHRVYIIHKG